ncbi:MAG TPA: filamentous hemagglutinin N-terminal domain-containing protein, partial [Rhodocyclaceae bacterium]|nr:filamentous hemagglutinin N-terminal domain-containing protein [Rhodocyclaceae bacterium]
MNHIYRVVWNRALNIWQVVAECARSAGKTRHARVGSVAVLASLGAGLAAAAGPLPTGGSIAAGTGSISQNGNSLTIHQTSNKLAIDWQGFSIGRDNTVNFVQPGTRAVALNRVLGSDVSLIQGALKANGQVFLINPNGVLFSPTAQVDVGSLVASTRDLSTSDFLAGRYVLDGAGSNAVINQGRITAAGDAGQGGTVALIAARVSNEGSVNAPAGNVLLAAGKRVTLDLGGPLKLQVEQGALDALVSNGGAIVADGGFIYLTARAADQLTTATVNNTGLVRARSLATGERGEIRLIGDLAHGTLNAGGTLDASAPQGGDGGFIETSAATVNMADTLAVTTLAPHGATGTLLVDPNNYTVAASGGNATGASFTSLINSNNVTISTASYGTAGGSGDIFINDTITKTAASGTTSLTFLAERNIAVNSSITSTGGPLNITLSAANAAAGTLGGVRVASSQTLNSNGGDILIGGAGGSVSGAQTPSHGIGYALNYSSSQEAVSIGSSANILSRGGNITINGNSTQRGGGSSDTTAVHIGASAVIDSGYYAPGATDASSGGFINISGKYTGGVGTNADKVFGVKIDNPSGNAGQTTLAASTTTGSIRIEGSSTYDTPGSYALNMATNGLAGNIYFNAYSVADLIFILNGDLKGVSFTYSPPTSGCRTGYPNCGLLSVNASANNSYLYATYNAVNMATLPIYVSATLSGTKVYDGTLTASNLSFSNVTVMDPDGSGYSSGNVTSATYVTPSANVGAYTNLSASALSRNYSANGNNYVLGYNFAVSPAYTVTPATASLSAVKTYNGDASFSNAQITASGVNGETLSLSGSGPATATSSAVADNAINYLTSLGGMTLANGSSGTPGLASNYTLPALSSRSAQNTATINAFSLTVLGVNGSKNYDGTTTFGTNQLNLGSGVVNGDDVHLAGSADVASKDVGTYTQWAASSLALTGSNSTNYTLSGGAVSAVINRAPLGVALNALYNGTTQFTSSVGATNASAGTINSGGTLTVSGLAGSERLTGVTVSDASVDAITAGKYVTGVSGSNGFLAGNYALYNGGTPAYHVAQSSGAITTLNNTVSISPKPLGVYATPTYNATAQFTAVSGVADGGTGTLATGGSVSVSGLVNGQTLGGFSVDSPDLVSAGKVTSVTLNGGIDARNYVLNGSTYGTATPTPGSAADGSQATNGVSMSAAPLGVTVGGTYSGSTSIVPTSFSTHGLLGSDTITQLSGATIDNSNVSANGSNFVRSVVVGSGTADIRNYALAPAYSAVVDAGGNATSVTTNVASLGRAPLGITVSGTYNGTTSIVPTSFSTYGLLGSDTLTGLAAASLNSPNVVANGSNFVTALTPSGGTANLANYQINPAYNGSVNGMGDASGTSANVATLARAPLGVAVSGTYTG